jgi:superfamily II DNA or RNA helicase
MSILPRGLYDRLLTEALAKLVGSLDPKSQPDVVSLRNADAADRIAFHVARIVERAVESLPDESRAKVGVQLARNLVNAIARDFEFKELQEERPVESAEMLRAIFGRQPDGSTHRIDSPLIPLLDTTILTNAPGEPRVGSQIRAEIGSADRIDIVMAFVRRSGILPMRDELKRHVDSGRKVRVLTTVYTGSTEKEALDLLVSIGAEVKVSYDTTSTRLHAKTWLFHRESGFSTAYVGSSNLTHSALVTGLEWNVRVSGARNRSVTEKIAAVFESYWQQPDFESYDPDRFVKATATTDKPTLTLSPIEVRLEPFQERLLEEIELSRQRGFHHNLLVSATGTGKTVMAAVDYVRLRERLDRSRLLFVAHREEILEQSRATFAHALRDGSFGELWVGGKRPTDFDHVFASIQSLNAGGLATLDPEHFDVVIIDEFHHAAAESYTRLLDVVKPKELVGLTATPERTDGLSILHWFDGRIAAELRLWDAIDQHRLTPFSYFGIADSLDLREIPWKRGTGYDVERLTDLITGTDVWARRVLKEFEEHLGRLDTVRCLGFCVSVAHARYMERVFVDAGVKARAVWADTPERERKSALADLAARRINVVFSVDLFNEGVDVPAVDALLMLRPTDSPLLFLQQLGRGLRKSPGKTQCTVLDFVGQHRKEFRYDRRFQALLGGSRASVIRQLEDGFPFLPAGCHMELDRVASERVLESIKRSVPTRWKEKAAELSRLDNEKPGLSLSDFLAESGLDLDDVYAGNRSWSDLREEARLHVEVSGPHEEALRRACGRLLHVDDSERLNFWIETLKSDAPPDVTGMIEADARLLKMLLTQLLDRISTKEMTIEVGLEIVWNHPQVRAELLELFKVLSERITHISMALNELPDVPLKTMARYTRHEILAGCGVTEGIRTTLWQTGVLFAKKIPADLFAFTLDKTRGGFSPTTRYRDYAISRDLIHWESQSATTSASKTGQRYQEHRSSGSHILLFARHRSDDRAFFFLGPATYVKHDGEMPMAITWRLKYPLPGDLFASFAAAVA